MSIAGSLMLARDPAVHVLGVRSHHHNHAATKYLVVYRHIPLKVERGNERPNKRADVRLETKRLA